MELAPLFEDIAHGPSGGVAHWLKTSDGLRIRVAHWPVENAKGTVLIFPGRTEYIEKYGIAAAELAARGFASIAIDWRGQGLADRMTPDRAVGHVGQFADYQRDVAAVMSYVAASNLPKPYFLMAHSMGGCIALRALLEGLNVNATVFSAPMWGILMAPGVRPFAKVLSTASMRLGFDQALAPGQGREPYVLRQPFAGNTLTNDPEMFALMGEQLRAQPDLCLGGPSLRWLNLAMREMDRLARLPSPKHPCLTFLGTNEAIVDPEAIRHRMANWKGGVLHEIAGGQHEMIMDSASLRAALFDKAAALFTAHG